MEIILLYSLSLYQINQLQEDEKQTVYIVINTMMTKQKFQTFLNQIYKFQNKLLCTRHII